jgi:hypothetical protein
MSTLQSSLAKIDTMLAALVGGRVTKKMGLPEFVGYAHAQIAKAMGEPMDAQTKRLKALHASVTVFKDNYSSDESVNVPIYENDVTAMDDKSSTMSTPLAAANTNPDGQSAFEQGFVAKFQALRDQVRALSKEFPPAEGDEEEEKRKAAAAASKDDAAPADEEEEEDEEKRKAFPPGAKAPPFGKKPPAKGDEPEDEEKAAAAKKRLAKGADVDKSPDGTAWPTDLNDPAFTKDGKVEKALDWGRDPA